MSQLTEGRSMGSYCAEKLHWKEMWGTDGEKSFSQTWVFLNAKLNLPWDSGCRRLCLSRTDGFTWSVCVCGGGPYETLFHCRCICYLIIALDRDFGVTDLHCATLSKISQVTVALSIRMEEKKKVMLIVTAGLCSLIKASCCQLFFSRSFTEWGYGRTTHDDGIQAWFIVTKRTLQECFVRVFILQI